MTSGPGQPRIHFGNPFGFPAPIPCEHDTSSCRRGVPMQRDLVERAMAGDHEAFSELARLSIGRLYAVARLILRDQERAEDATQEALVAAWRDLSGLRDPDRFEAWLHRLLVRACYREARSTRRRQLVEVNVRPLDEAAPDTGPDLADRDQL